jgi:hypothetical protein
MNRTTKTLLKIAAVGAVGYFIYKMRKRNTWQILKKVSDHGYETAGDVHFPTKGRRGRQHLGPVYPGSKAYHRALNRRSN